MELKMTEGQTLPKHMAESQNVAGGKPKKKASWWRTIMWMLSMVLLTNVVMGIIAYFLFFADK